MHVTDISPISIFVDSTPDNSSKTFIVPAGEMWVLNHAFVQFVSNATAGSRRVALEVKSPGGAVLFKVSAGMNQVASLTYNYNFHQAITRETAVVNSDCSIPIPQQLHLPSGSQLKFYDAVAVAPTADDMTVTFSVKCFRGGF